MRPHTPWSRRAFLQGMGYTSALGVLNKAIPAPGRSNAILPTGFAYLASSGEEAGEANGVDTSGIHVFEVRGDDWYWKQTIPSRSPVSLVLHPNQQFLYAANAVDEYERLPRGTVEAYRIDAHSGSLALMNRKPLSLSGIMPRHIAISPDGNYLIAAIHGGGAYNVLALSPDGALGGVTQIVKEVGAGPHPVYQVSAHPHTIVFDATGRYILTADEGCDRISVFDFQHGRMIRTHQTVSLPVSGPGHMAKHPSGNFLYISNSLDGSIDCFKWDAGVGKIEHQRRVTPGPNTDPYKAKPLVISASGDFLYSVFANEGISVWKIDPVTGKLSLIQQEVLTNSSLSGLILSPDNRRLFVSDGRQHELLSMPVHAGSGKLGPPFTVARTPSPGSLVVKYV
jgi:6-phosphogluconolactonase